MLRAFPCLPTLFAKLVAHPFSWSDWWCQRYHIAHPCYSPTRFSVFISAPELALPSFLLAGFTVRNSWRSFIQPFVLWSQALLSHCVAHTTGCLTLFLTIYDIVLVMVVICSWALLSHCVMHPAGPCLVSHFLLVTFSILYCTGSLLSGCTLFGCFVLDIVLNSPTLVLPLPFWFNHFFFTQSSEWPCTSILFSLTCFWNSLSFVCLFPLDIFCSVCCPFSLLGFLPVILLPGIMTLLPPSLGCSSGVIFSVCTCRAPQRTHRAPTQCVKNTHIQTMKVFEFLIKIFFLATVISTTMVVALHSNVNYNNIVFCFQKHPVNLMTWLRR